MQNFCKKSVFCAGFREKSPLLHHSGTKRNQKKQNLHHSGTKKEQKKKIQEQKGIKSETKGHKKSPRLPHHGLFVRDFKNFVRITN